jgi:hypothetical protein
MLVRPGERPTPSGLASILRGIRGRLHGVRTYGAALLAVDAYAARRHVERFGHTATFVASLLIRPFNVELIAGIWVRHCGLLIRVGLSALLLVFSQRLVARFCESRLHLQRAVVTCS